MTTLAPWPIDDGAAWRQEQMHQLYLHNPVVHLCLSLVNAGLESREEALEWAVIHLAHEAEMYQAWGIKLAAAMGQLGDKEPSE